MLLRGAPGNQNENCFFEVKIIMGEIMKGYKNLNADMTCRGFKFEVGKKYTHAGSINMCSAGFHFHVNPADLFLFYPLDLTQIKVAEVECEGEILHGKTKSVCSEITVIRILTTDEIKTLGNCSKNYGWANSGERNAGRRNAGDFNAGDFNEGISNAGHSNAGHFNAGHSNEGDFNAGNSNEGHFNAGHSNEGDFNAGNSNEGHSNAGNFNEGEFNAGHSNEGHSNAGNFNAGHFNAGDFNAGNFNAGYFNTITPCTINVFNKKCLLSVWQSAKKPKFIFFNKKWSEIESKITKQDIELLIKLPNFDEDVFCEISGYDLDDLKRFEILYRKF